MASGDALRVWFPEMTLKLSNKWKEGMSWKQCSVFCASMTKYRNQLRNEKKIKSAMIFCKNCGTHHAIEPLPISIRSMLVALKKISKINNDQFKELERSWKKHQKEFNLDNYGNLKS